MFYSGVHECWVGGSKSRQMPFQSFKKKSEKILDVDNDEIYYCAKTNPKLVVF
jgi:hypothetical protein